jgi:hypothetical protein
MEHQLWKAIVALLADLDNPRTPPLRLQRRRRRRDLLLGGDARPPDVLGLLLQEMADPPARRLPSPATMFRRLRASG